MMPLIFLGKNETIYITEDSNMEKLRFKIVQKVFREQKSVDLAYWVQKREFVLNLMLTLDAKKIRSCKILADSCKNDETSKILSEVVFSCKILADNFDLVRFLAYFVILALILADTVLLERILQDYWKKFNTCNKLTRFVIFCKISQDICENKALPCKILKEFCKNLAR